CRDPDRLTRTDGDERPACGRREGARPWCAVRAVRAVRSPAATTSITGSHLPRERLLALVVDPTGDQQDLPVPPRTHRLLIQPREDHDLDRALEVLEGHDRHRRL